MIKSLPLMVTIFFAFNIVGLISSAEDYEIIFHDDFKRKDSESVGNDWSLIGSLRLKNNAARFQVDEEEFRPRMKHSFPVQNSGTFKVSFLMDWLRTSEGTWAFYMQLGNSKHMPRFLIRQPDLAKGMAVNLLWGGGDMVDGRDAGSFGYLNDGTFHPLCVVNDAKIAKTVVKPAIVSIDVDVDSNVYHITLNGKRYVDLPFENKVPIDTIRFITNGCSATGFSKSAIDNVMISKDKSRDDES